MSISLMTAAFRASLPTTQKFVLLALCDAANDQGECYPSIATVCEKCSLSERAVQAAVRELERLGYVRRDFRTGRSTVYWLTTTPAAAAPPQQLHPRKSRTPAGNAPPHDVHPTPAGAAPPPPQQVHPTPAPRAPRTIKEPSVEPKRNQAGSGFDRFWAAWPDHPRKAAKSQCAAEWAAMGCEAIVDDVVAAVEASKLDEAWTKDGGAYVPAPKRWLEEARWTAPTREQAAAQRQAEAWAETRDGVDGKARELGLETWAEYERERVRKGVTPHYGLFKRAVIEAAERGVPA